ncbi:MAG: DUF2877 domain-containing protein [Elusimicrobia bacterium]|nr:DUF2877 domain-containing protein [Elusimicrobiota bacterium]
MSDTRLLPGRTLDVLVSSVGDAVRPGRYVLHSSFASALNFLGGGRLVSLVSPRVGPGPANVVLDGPLPRGASSLAVEGGGLGLDGRVLPLPSPPYRSTLDGVSPERARVEVNLRRLSERLPAMAPVESLVFLLGDGGPCEAGGGEVGPGRGQAWARAARDWMRRACGELFGGSLAAGVRMLRGAGRGLTPAGDDFLCGVLAALDVVGRVSGRDRRPARGEVCRLALGGNPLSNAFLRLSRDGRYHHRHKGFLEALMADGEGAALRRAGGVLGVGATSGADWLTGFTLSMERWRGSWSSRGRCPKGSTTIPSR